MKFNKNQINPTDIIIDTKEKSQIFTISLKKIEKDKESNSKKKKIGWKKRNSKTKKTSTKRTIG